jgi:uncharacterized protein YndB with AHSA1/START domain
MPETKFIPNAPPPPAQNQTPGPAPGSASPTATQVPVTAAQQGTTVWGPPQSEVNTAVLKADQLWSKVKAGADPTHGFPTAMGDAVQTFQKLATDQPQDFHASAPSEADPTPWPSGFDPKKSPVFAHNEIDIPQPPAVVFKALTQATQWPSWYPNSGGIQIQGGGDALGPHSKFAWTTFGTRQNSQVTQYVPSQAIGWTAQGAGTQAFHRWLLYPDGKGGTRVVTEECQTGATPTTIKLLMNPGLHAAHQLWLRGLSGAVGAPVTTPAKAGVLAAAYNVGKNFADQVDLDAAQVLGTELSKLGFDLDTPFGKPPVLKRPVFMIPGFTMQASSYDPMAQHLASDPANGPVAVYASADHAFHLGSSGGRVLRPEEVEGIKIFELDYADPSAPSVDPKGGVALKQPTGKAAEIARALADIQQYTHQVTVDVVAHSAGCTDFRAYLQSRDQGTGPNIGRTVLVGPASHGTAMGNLGAVAGQPFGLAAGGAQLADGAELIDTLNQTWANQLKQMAGGVTIVGIVGAPTPGPGGLTQGDGFMPRDTVGMPGAKLVVLRGLNPTPIAHLTEIGKPGVLRVADEVLAGN